MLWYYGYSVDALNIIDLEQVVLVGTILIASTIITPFLNKIFLNLTISPFIYIV